MGPVTLPAVLLHGFAGTGRTWDGVRGMLGDTDTYTPDLPGHGRLGDTKTVDLDACVTTALAAVDGEIVLGGYSMGGRIALHAALAAPQRVRGLVLVATTAGIEDAAERAARRRADEALADICESGSIEDFATRWMSQPVFGGSPDSITDTWARDIERNDPVALARALRGIGTGVLAPLWDRLHELQMPVRVLAGERDAKFVAIAQRLSVALPDSRLTIVPQAGHGLVREAPAAVAGALQDVLRP